ncbi:MAG: hypothetical protein NZT61_00355 [Deltaproteobacteria bacterium]|nr:hypothetical protein [Deltaproteobacteria bacterium]
MDSVTIGVFDGVHLGHQAVINSLQGTSSVITFRTNPKFILNRVLYNKPIVSFREFATILKHSGVDFLIVLNFKKISHLTGYEFLTLVKHYLRPRVIVSGVDNRVGRDRLELSYDVAKSVLRADKITVPSFYVRNLKVSSSRLRECVIKGDLKAYTDLTGRKFRIYIKSSDRHIFVKRQLLPNGIFKTMFGQVAILEEKVYCQDCVKIPAFTFVELYQN